MNNDRNQAYRQMLLAGFLASSIYFCAAQAPAAQTPAPATDAQHATPASTPAPVPMTAGARLISSVHTISSARGATRYAQIWGIDNLKLQPTASGGLIRFSYRVLDPVKAQVLNDKKKDPYLVIGSSGRRVELEEAERLGKMRQTATPESGREYWMIFGNASHSLQPGDKVDVVIGPFHAYGLFVEQPEAAAVRKP
jgi:hypothetical protein